MPFSTLGLAPVLCAPLARLGYTVPTPVQSAAIPVVLEGHDLIARAQTGTGKTAAFALPLIDRLFIRNPSGSARRPRVLVLVPTRELALQVHKAFATYAEPVRMRVTAIFGGVSMGAQIRELRAGVDVVVATPGRLIDHLDRRTVDLSGVEALVLDEADRMLDMGFQPALRRILPVLPKQRQTLCFSATLSSAVNKLSGDFTRDARKVDVSNGDVVAATITHRVHPVDLDRKRALLVHVLKLAPANQALVFCKTKRGADRVGQHLEGAGLSAAVIHGDKNQASRTRSLAQFKAGRVGILVATDIAARGIDVAQLPLVVNYDLPLVAEDYIHRVGRTGRAGATGRAVSLVTSQDLPLLRDIQRLLAAPLEHEPVAGFETTSVSSAPAAARPSAPPARRNFGNRGRSSFRGRGNGDRPRFAVSR